ncbi:MAG: radical SAM protein [Candidatus Aminicenantes bacterium]|nr:radical SAM protein [Candidatus Aminicenantes bacterium]
MKRKVYLYNATECPRRTLDCTNIRDFLKENGHFIVENPEEADDILLFTCAAWDMPEQYSVEALKKLKTYQKNLILMGCLSEINPELLDMFFNGIKIPPKTLHSIQNHFSHETSFSCFDRGNDCSSYLRRPFEIQRNLTRISSIRNIPKQLFRYVKSSVYFGPVRTFRMAFDLLTRKKEYSLKIATGCVWNCSYCAVKWAIGRLVSRPLEECDEEAREAVREGGYRRVRLIADDVGSYGLDIGISFVDILDRLTRINKFFTLSLGELNPVWILRHYEQFNEILKRKKIVSLVVPVQSASQRIIGLMNRKYDIESVKEHLSGLKRRHRYLHLITHIIAAFPTETSEEINKNVSFIRDVPIDAGNVIMYSDRPGTESSKMDGHFPQEEKERRMGEYFRLLKKSRYQAEFREKTPYAIYFTR